MFINCHVSNSNCEGNADIDMQSPHISLRVMALHERVLVHDDDLQNCQEFEHATRDKLEALTAEVRLRPPLDKLTAEVRRIEELAVLRFEEEENANDCERVLTVRITDGSFLPLSPGTVKLPHQRPMHAPRR